MVTILGMVTVLQKHLGWSHFCQHAKFQPPTLPRSGLKVFVGWWVMWNETLVFSLPSWTICPHGISQWASNGPRLTWGPAQICMHFCQRSLHNQLIYGKVLTCLEIEHFSSLNIDRVRAIWKQRKSLKVLFWKSLEKWTLGKNMYILGLVGSIFSPFLFGKEI